jgi:cellulose synthase/poly-beta-1,6-N-acetylglucosamine synthase-like glycosyltransferase
VDASILDHFPDVFVVVPIFREDPGKITRLLDSIVRSDYPKKRMHIFLSFDEDSINYLDFLKNLGVWETVTKCQFGETVYHGMNVFVTKFYHSGKRSSQV